MDIYLVSGNMIDYVQEFGVNQTDFLPSDHAPISLKIDVPGTDIHDLFSRACQLGEHPILEYPRHNSRVKRPIKWARIHHDAFYHNLRLFLHVTREAPRTTSNHE